MEIMATRACWAQAVGMDEQGDMLFQTIQSILSGAVAGIIAAVVAGWIFRRYEASRQLKREQDQIGYLRAVILGGFRTMFEISDEEQSDQFPSTAVYDEDALRREQLEILLRDLTSALDRGSPDIEYAKLRPLRNWVVAMERYLSNVMDKSRPLTEDVCLAFYLSLQGVPELKWLRLPGRPPG